MKAVFQLLEGITRLLMYTGALAGILLTCFVVLSSVMRYLVRAPFPFTEELVGLLFSAMIFLTLPYCTIKKSHVCVTLVRDMLGGTLRRIADLAAALFMIAFAVIFGILSYDFAAFSYDLGSVTEMGEIILFPWMGLMPLACVLMAVVAVVLMVRQQFGGSASREHQQESDF
jgi:TRAP-type C4-dicarboxylate transport system permease small subunit